MLYRRNGERQLSHELFRDPTCEYRGTPFWSWNCRVTKELIDEQLEVFRRMGFGGAHLHPRTGMENEYLGDEYLELVRYADEKAKEKGLLCWLYDEDRYPSGTAGGLVTEDITLRARHLLLTRERKEGMCASRREFLERAARGEKPAGYFLTSYRVRVEKGCLSSCCRVEGPEPEWDCPEDRSQGELWLAYVELMRESPWFNGSAYLDVMNKKAVERFISLTHERYLRVLGEEFGHSIPAIFTDEPQIKGSMNLPDAECGYDVTLSFTDDFPETYQEAYGDNFLDIVPELLWELPEGRFSVQRRQYHDHLAERFVSAYSDTIAEWCGRHRIAMTGHYMSEPTLYTQTLRLGEAMRCYRRQQIPGIDILCGDPEYTTAKQAVSAARQNGCEAVLSELYGVTHWDFDFKGHKLQGDWQAALGITVRCHHLAFMSMAGEAKRDWPASISYQSPWYEKYAYIEDYFARLNTALTRGKAEVKLGVIHPIESYWMAFGTVEGTKEIRGEMDSHFLHLTEWLLFGLMDFDFLSESLLPEQTNGSKETKPRQDGPEQTNGSKETKPRQDGPVRSCPPVLRVGEMAYEAVIVPDLLTIRGTTLELLEHFVREGGQVIFAGQVPGLVDGRESDRARQLAGKDGVTVCPFVSRRILEAAEPYRTLDIRRADGSRTDHLFSQIREDGEVKWLFVCHVKRKKNRVDQAEALTVRVRGEYHISVYDALTGRIFPVEATWKDGWTCAAVTLYAEDSFLWKLSERDRGEDEIEADLDLPPEKAASPAEAVGDQAGTVTSPAGAVGDQAGTVTSPAEAVRDQAGTVTSPAEAVGDQAGTVTSPVEAVGDQAGTMTSPAEAVGDQAGAVTVCARVVTSRPGSGGGRGEADGGVSECTDHGLCPAQRSRQTKPREVPRRVPVGTPAEFYGLVAGPPQGPGGKAEVLCTVTEPDDISPAEPNVLYLDTAAFSLNGGAFHPLMEILRLDNEIRRELGYPPRQDASIQPWRLRDAPEKDQVALRYEISSEISTGPLLLAMETPRKAAICLNGIKCSNCDTGYFVDSFIRTVPVPGLAKGKNVLTLELPFGRKTNLENVYLLGDFGVEVQGTRAVVTKKQETCRFGDITRQRMPFYCGNLDYGLHFTLERQGRVSVKVPHFAAPVLEVILDGKEAGLIAFAPHILNLGELAAGNHQMVIRAYGNRFNSFGTLHNCNDEYKWYGPDSYRTTGSDWSEAWCLRPFGILSRVEILRET